jgi:predicted nucleotidyltransferase
MGTVTATIEGRALAATKVLARLGVVRAAYIFGSHVQGTADTWSDIDVAIFIEGLERWDIRRRATAMAIVMEEAGSDVEAHLFSASALDNPPVGSFVEYVLRQGAAITPPQ